MWMAASRRPFDMNRLYVVMGVSGCGKSTIAEALAAKTGGSYLDGDTFHPPHNIALMRAGTPLSDADRWPWLEIVGAQLAQKRGQVFCACSALKRAYRAYITRTAGEPVCFLHLQGSRQIIEERMQARTGHFMPPSLLDSQFAALEVPQNDELAINIDISGRESDIVEQLVAKIGELNDQ